MRLAGLLDAQPGDLRALLAMGYAALAALEPAEDTSIAAQLGLLHAGNGHHDPADALTEDTASTGNRGNRGNGTGKPTGNAGNGADAERRARAADACRDDSLSFYGSGSGFGRVPAP